MLEELNLTILEKWLNNQKLKKEIKEIEKNIKDLINGLADLNQSLEDDGHVPFEEYEVVKL